MPTKCVGCPIVLHPQHIVDVEHRNLSPPTMLGELCVIDASVVVYDICGAPVFTDRQVRGISKWLPIQAV